MSTLADLKRRTVESELLTPAQWDEAVAAAPAETAADPDKLLAWLAADSWLTEFQADALAAGLTGPFLLGPYRVREKIAAGRLGDVFQAQHVEFDQPVSLKVFSAALAKDPENLARMQREVRVAAQLDHPHILRSFQVGLVGQIYYLAFEDLRGESLETRLARQGRMPYAEACRLLRHVALGLESLHEADVIHRDLRPANMWINEQEQLKLMEFGAARDALAFLDKLDGREELTQQDSALGDYLYRAPEAAADARKADAQSDIYSLGCTLYHTLTGQPPFVNKNPMRLVLSHANDVPRAVTLHAPDVPQSLADLVARLLAKNPAERPTAAEIDWTLQPLVDDSDLSIAAAEQTWNPDYLAWAREANASAAPESAAANETGLSNDLSEFLDWLTTTRH